MSEFDTVRNIERLFKQKTLLDIALEIEKFLDFMNVYVYPNWFDGELVDGPNVSRYWVTVTLRYDYKKMPDPMGARILHDIGVKVDYKKDIIMEPIKIKGPEDFRPNSKKPKLLPKDIWHVELKIPRRFIDDIDYNELEELDDEIDSNDIGDVADSAIDIKQDDVEPMSDVGNEEGTPAEMPGEENV